MSKKEEKVKEETKKEEPETLVVSKLPKQEIRQGVDDNGNEYNLETIEEAITIMRKQIDDIHKAI